MNNAGVGATASILESDIARMQEMIALNVNAAGMPLAKLPTEIVMSADDLVDAALAGLDQGEPVTIPSLPDSEEWHAFEAGRRSMANRLSSSVAASRYGLSAIRAD